MHNKKIIAKGLAYVTLLSSVSVNSSANSIKEYDTIKENRELVSSKKNAKTSKRIYNAINPAKANKNIVKNSVLQITLSEGDSVPDLSNNPSGHETIRVITTGDKKLDYNDFSNLNYSTIPNIDLSGAKADSIPSYAFTNNINLNEFKFPQGVTSIGEEAFQACVNLSGTLSLPNTLTTIRGNAFYGCSRLTGDLIIPNSVTSIGSNAFADCVGFNGVLELSNKMTAIGGSAFYGCSGLTGDLIIPSSVSSIGGSAFRGCSGFNGILELPDTITNIEGGAFYGCSKLTGNLVIPSSLKKITSNLFRGCYSFTGDLIIPDTVTVVDVNAFYGCSGFDGKLVLSKNIKTVPANAFIDCSKLKGDIIIPDGVTTIGASAFYNCRGFNGDLEMPDSITSIGANAFYNCSGLSGQLILPNSLKTVGRGVFRGTNFTGDVYVPNALTTVDTNMFSDSIDRIIIKVSEEDVATDYRKNVISSFTASKVHIEAPSTLDFTGTWVEESNIKVIQPIVKNLVDGVENEVVDENNEKIILEIPMLFIKDECYASKDGEVYNFPQANIDGKYIFTDEGDYEVVVKTKLGTTYNVQFGVRTKEMQEAQDLVTEIIDTTPTIETFDDVRRKVNALPESFRKEELQRMLNSISVDLELEKKNATANLDIYIKSESMLSLSLDTNSVTFDNYNGTEDVVKPNAINLTVNSSLPYKVDASLESEIQNSNKSNTMDISLFNIKDSNDSDFKEFTGVGTPLTLLDDQPKGNGNNHSIDLKLKGSLAHKADIYKTTIKLEVEQK